jgi:hypothetical protein
MARSLKKINNNNLLSCPKCKLGVHHFKNICWNAHEGQTYQDVDKILIFKVGKWWQLQNLLV